MNKGVKPAAPANKHSLKHTQGIKREKIINALANGDTLRKIESETGHSQHTIIAVKRSEQQQIAAVKEQLAIQAREIAQGAGKRLIEHLDANTLPVNLLPSTYGIAIDKHLALSNDTPAQAIVNVAILNR